MGNFGKGLLWAWSHATKSTQVADIERIVAKQQGNGKWVGLGIGGVIDVIMTFVALKSLENSFDGLFDFGF